MCAHNGYTIKINLGFIFSAYHWFTFS